MSGKHIAVVPVGKINAEEVEAALVRAARVLRRPLELRAALPVPMGIEDRERGQHRAALLMAKLRATFARLGRGKLVGEGDATTAALPPKPDAIVFVTDADLFTGSADAVFSALIPAKGLGIVSLRRLREAFYRRRADPNKQRARLTKEVVRAAARLGGMPECSSPQCVLAPSNMLADVDLKDEGLCRACAQRMFKGTLRI